MFAQIHWNLGGDRPPQNKAHSEPSSGQDGDTDDGAPSHEGVDSCRANPTTSDQSGEGDQEGREAAPPSQGMSIWG